MLNKLKRLMPEAAIHEKPPPAPERETSGPTPEFSRRVLAGSGKTEFLNPNTTLPIIAKDDLGNLSGRDYTIFNSRSKGERRAYWQTKEQKTFDEQKQAWTQEVTGIFAESKNFFASERGSRWTSLCERFGLNAQQITKESLEKFYENYLQATDQKEEGIKRFIQDLLTSPSYQNTSGGIDQEKLQQDQPAIEWLASMFGEKSSEVISRLSDAEAQLQIDPEKIVQEKDVTMTTTEIALLEFLSGERYKGSETAEENPPEQPPEETQPAPTPDDVDDNDSILSQPYAPLTRTEAPTEETLVDKRVHDQILYIDRVRERYTTTRLADLVYISRFGKRRDGQQVTQQEQAKAEKEARRVQSFLHGLNKEPKDYVTELEEINQAFPPMHAATKFSVVIPAYREQGRIAKALESWINQQDKNNHRIAPGTLEMLVLVNRPNETRGFDDTAQAIEAFKKRHPDYAPYIHVVEKTFNFPNEQRRLPDGKEITVPTVSMGLIYRFATDLALLRNLNRSGRDKTRIANHLIRTGGGDAVARNPHHVDYILSVFEDNPRQEQYVSLSDYHPDVYRKIPLLFLSRQLYDAMNEYLTRGFSHIGLGTYRTALYGEAGGFEHREKIAEEMELSRRMRTAIVSRGQDINEARKRDMVLNALDDPRRDIAALFTGKPLTQSYSDYDVNEAVRSINITDVLSNSLPPQVELTSDNFSKQADAIFKFYLGQFIDPRNKLLEPEATELTATYFRRALTALGIAPDDIQILYKGAPYTKDTFAEDLGRATVPIDILRQQFFISIKNTPSTETIEKVMEERFHQRDGDWAFSAKTAA